MRPVNLKIVKPGDVDIFVYKTGRFCPKQGDFETSKKNWNARNSLICKRALLIYLVCVFSTEKS